MNKLSRVFVALAVIASTIVVPHALAQRTTPPPSDAKLMHDVEAVLQNEKAFRGLTIVPKTSRGIVTLTGTVSSEGDKVLAGLEVGNVEGVKTVINNLDVKGSALDRRTSSRSRESQRGADSAALDRSPHIPRNRRGTRRPSRENNHHTCEHIHSGSHHRPTDLENCEGK